MRKTPTTTKKKTSGRSAKDAHGDTTLGSVAVVDGEMDRYRSPLTGMGLVTMRQVDFIREKLPAKDGQVRVRLDRAATTMLAAVGKAAAEGERIDRQRFCRVGLRAISECIVFIDLLLLRESVAPELLLEARDDLRELAAQLELLLGPPRPPAAAPHDQSEGASRSEARAASLDPDPNSAVPDDTLTTDETPSELGVTGPEALEPLTHLAAKDADNDHGVEPVMDPV